MSVRTEANCNFTEARGRIYNTQGQPLAGARVKVIVPGYEWNAVSHPTSASGEFDLHLGLGPKPGHWEFFVVEADRRVSEIVPFDSNNDCRMGRQLIFIEFAKNY